MEKNSHTLTLTQAMLDNGHIDLPMSAKHLFPSDSFGSRAKNDTGAPVEIRFGSHRAMTDIRIKSSKTFSPRRRVYRWLNTDLRAQPGDQIRIDKLDDRVFAFAPVDL